MYGTVEQLAAHLGIPAGVSREDATSLDLALRAASAAVDQFCGRRFTAATAPTARVFRGGSDHVQIEDVTAVTLIETSADQVSWSTLTGSWWEPLNAAADGVPFNVLCASQPLPEWVRVTGLFGWPSVPPEVQQATLIKAARLWKRKDSPTGIAEGLEGFGSTYVSRKEDGDVVILLSPLRHLSRIAGIA